MTRQQSLIAQVSSACASLQTYTLAVDAFVFKAPGLVPPVYTPRDMLQDRDTQTTHTWRA